MVFLLEAQANLQGEPGSMVVARLLDGEEPDAEE